VEGWDPEPEETENEPPAAEGGCSGLVGLGSCLLIPVALLFALGGSLAVGTVGSTWKLFASIYVGGLWLSPALLLWIFYITAVHPTPQRTKHGAVLLGVVLVYLAGFEFLNAISLY
jgi:hypothetical protein